jgi:putative ATP-binding cassette transporter
MGAHHEITPVSEQASLERRLLVRFWQTAANFWRGRWAKVAWGLTAFLVLVVLAQLLVQLLLNLWNRNFFDALQRRDAAALWQQALLFLPLALASIVLGATSVWGRMTAQRRWRECVTRLVIEYWLAEDRFRRLDQIANGSENPEYRISEDVRVATDAPIDLVLAFLASLLTAITFMGVLWSVGGSLNFEAFGSAWTIPAYLVIGVIVYSTVFSTAMIIVGRRLTTVIERKNQAEAELRAAADRLRQDGSGAIGSGNETAERRTLWLALHTVLARWLGLMWQLVGTTLVSHSNFVLAPVLALLLCVPKFLTGTMSLGELTQSAAAFVTVQSAFNWLVDNYGRLADWRSSVNRVASLLLVLDAVAALERIEEETRSEALGALKPALKR